MTLRSRLLRITGAILFLLLGGSAEGALWAQDRGAPQFGPAAPGDTVGAEASDAGRLWSLADPPFSRFERRYGVEADSAWATHLRRGVLRLPDCTGALASSQGLVLTTARCARRHLETQRSNVFVAEEQDAERSLPDLHADRLISATDVTAQVQAARQQDRSPQEAIQRVQRQLQSEAEVDRRVDVESAAGGAQYTAYVHRRYEDIRLVFLPDRTVSAFGGGEAAVSYPRHALDVALLRVYGETGAPLTPMHFFDAPTQGRRPGDAVFSVGYGSGTHRIESTDQLAFRRDVTLPVRQSLLETWTQTLQTSLESEGEEPKASSSRWGRALNQEQRTLKRTRARLQALRTEYVMTRLRSRDARLRERIQRDPSGRRSFEGVLDSLATIQSAKRELASAYRAFAPLDSESYNSSTLRRALLAHRAYQADGNPRDSLVQQISEVRSQPSSLDTEMLTVHLDALRAYLQPDSAAVRRLLRGQSPAERAASVVASSALTTADFLPEPRQEEASLPSEDDPALSLVDAFADSYRLFQQKREALHRAEEEQTRRLAQARHEFQRSPVLPAAEGMPRLTDGRLRGYPYNGTLAPPFTTFYGLLGRAQAHRGEAAWELPQNWRTASGRLDRSTPLNMATSVDNAAASPGAPLLNQYLEIVGVASGSNVQGLASTYIYLPKRMRTVGVDLRGLRQVLTEIHGAETLVDELFGTSSASENESP